MLICEAQKAELGYEQCKVSFHKVYDTTMDDLAPDIDKLETSAFQDEANGDDSDAGNLETDDDQQLLAHVTRCKVLPPSDIR